MDFMLLALFMFFIGGPLLLVFIGIRVAGTAKRLAERQNKNGPRYPVEQVLQQTYEPEGSTQSPEPYDAP